MNITKATAQGQRSYQEDRFVVSNTKDGKLISVMDGHGGAQVSARLSTALPGLWKKHMEFPASITTAIQNTFRDLNTLTRDMGQGSTMSLVFIPKSADVVYVAILGDSPVVIRDVEGRINISPMHNARSNPTELAAAQERGAFFSGGYIFRSLSGSGIQMTRVFGDRELDSIVNREPEIYSVPVNQDSFVLVATDGLFDPSNRETEAEIAKVVVQIQDGVPAQGLVDRAVQLPTGDNVTAILVLIGNKKARKHAKKNTSEAKTDPIILEPAA